MKRIIYLLILMFFAVGNIFPQSWMNNLRNSANRIYSETKRNISHYSNQIKHDYARQRENLSKNINGNYSKWKKKVSQYGSSINKTMQEIYENPSKLDEFGEKANNVMKNGTITVLRNVPIYDPKRGEVVTFDNYSKNLVKNLGLAEGNDFENDPVAVTVGLMMDDNYLLRAKIIPAKSGYISIEEMTSNGFSQEQINRIYDKYYSLKKKYKRGDSDFGKTFVAFTSNLNGMKKEVNYVKLIEKYYDNIHIEIEDFFEDELGLSFNLSEILAHIVIIFILLLVLRILWKVLSFPFRHVKRLKLKEAG